MKETQSLNSRTRLLATVCQLVLLQIATRSARVVAEITSERLLASSSSFKLLEMSSVITRSEP
jgi:hypothetical protein